MQAIAHFVIEAIDDGEGRRSFQLNTYLNRLNEAISKANAEGWDGRAGLRITIFNPDDSLKAEMQSTQPEQAVSIGRGVSAIWEVPLAKAFGPEAINVTLEFARDVFVGIVAHTVADWILTKFSGHSEKLTINRKEVLFDRGEIVRTIEEVITLERR